MMELRNQIIAALTTPVTFMELMDQLDFTGLPPRKSATGQTIGFHGLVMEILLELVKEDVAVEQRTGTVMQTYRLSTPACDRWAA